MSQVVNGYDKSSKEYKDAEKLARNIAEAIGAGIRMIAYALISGFFIMLFWNSIVPTISNGTFLPIDYVQGCILYMLGSLFSTPKGKIVDTKGDK